MKIVKKGKWWFRIIKSIAKVKYKKPDFVFLGEKFVDGSIILSNHEGAASPMTLEMYLDRKFRFWGTHEMNTNFKMLYRYQTRVYYHQKHHWNIHLARLFCLIASPLTYLFYKGLNLISTYPDIRFFKTVKKSYDVIKDNGSVVIFPEDSSKGYLAEMTSFYSGFLVLAEYAYKHGKDIPIVVAYFQTKKKRYIFDNPIKYSELLQKYGDKDSITDALLHRCNEMGKMDFDNKK